MGVRTVVSDQFRDVERERHEPFSSRRRANHCNRLP
jgi:hypothetical protein